MDDNSHQLMLKISAVLFLRVVVEAWINTTEQQFLPKYTLLFGVSVTFGMMSTNVLEAFQTPTLQNKSKQLRRSGDQLLQLCERGEERMKVSRLLIRLDLFLLTFLFILCSCLVMKNCSTCSTFYYLDLL